jgi:nitroreductase
MLKKKGLKKFFVLMVILIFLNLSMVCIVTSKNQVDEYILPPPKATDIILEDSICRRMSIREFNANKISDEDLSSILYAAIGTRSDGNYTVSGINGVNAGIIYVLKEDAAYRYNSVNHSLVIYKDGDWRDIVGWQYPGAPVVLGLCWDKNLAGPNFGGAELGEIGQNIAFMANALGIGTVVTGEVPPAINRMGIPENEEGLIVMPLGYPLNPYNFKYGPMWISFLPKISSSAKSLSDAIEDRTSTASFYGDVSRKELSQLIWSSYGFSYNLDKSNQDKNKIIRHRTIPSAHGYYPLIIFAVTKNGVFRYQPNILTKIFTVPVDFLGLPILTYLWMTRYGDKRGEIANASSLPAINSAPLSIIMVLDLDLAKDLSSEELHKFWYYEAGAAAHNIMLEAAVLGFKSNIAYPTNQGSIINILKLNNRQFPLLIVPLGK